MNSVPADLLRPIIEWANTHYSAFVPNGASRKFWSSVRSLPCQPPDEFYEVKSRVLSEAGLTGLPTEPLFGDFLGYIQAGGAIHPHTDPDRDGAKHVRINVMASKPEFGGLPVQDGQVLDIGEGDVWRCDASVVRHWCTPVAGQRPRIVLSFGVLVPQ